MPTPRICLNPNQPKIWSKLSSDFINYSDFNVYRIVLDSFEAKFKIKVANNRETNFDQLFYDTPLPHVISSRIWDETTIWDINSFYVMDYNLLDGKVLHPFNYNAEI
jgi:hypothetical protein